MKTYRLVTLRTFDEGDESDGTFFVCLCFVFCFFVLMPHK